MKKKKTIIRPARVEVVFEKGQVGCTHCPYCRIEFFKGLNYCELSRVLMDKDGQAVHCCCPIEFQKDDFEEE